MAGTRRNRNDGIRKICGCPERRWPKCAHPWHFAFMWKRKPWRFSLNKQLDVRELTMEKAIEAAERIRSEIRAGTFVLAVDVAPPAPATISTPDVLSFTAYGKTFLLQCPIRRGKNKGKPRAVVGPDGQLRGDDAWKLTRLGGAPGADGQPLGGRAIGGIIEADLEAAMAHVSKRAKAASSWNKYLELLRLMSKWGIRKGYLSRSWFSPDNDETELTKRAGAKRSRRIEPDEERRILKQAPAGLQRLILAALETACRQGELLGLPWGDVSLARKEFTVRDTKTGAERTLPISPEFAAILEMVRYDPTGAQHGPNAYVFGNTIGGRVSFPRKAWETAVLKAHGFTPEWTATGGLAPESRAALRSIDVEFKDLRHEAGSRLLERGWPLHHIQLMLGHANLSQTSTYLNATQKGLQDSMKRFARPRLQSFASGTPGEHRPPRKRKGDRSQEATIN